MARIRRYDLYEGDGEVIDGEEAWGRHSALPGKATKSAFTVIPTILWDP